MVRLLCTMATRRSTCTVGKLHSAWPVCDIEHRLRTDQLKQQAPQGVRKVPAERADPRTASVQCDGLATHFSGLNMLSMVRLAAGTGPAANTGAPARQGRTMLGIVRRAKWRGQSVVSNRACPVSSSYSRHPRAHTSAAAPGRSSPALSRSTLSISGDLQGSVPLSLQRSAAAGAWGGGIAERPAYGCRAQVHAARALASHAMPGAGSCSGRAGRAACSRTPASEAPRRRCSRQQAAGSRQQAAGTPCCEGDLGGGVAARGAEVSQHAARGRLSGACLPTRQLHQDILHLDVIVHKRARVQHLHMAGSSDAWRCQTRRPASAVQAGNPAGARSAARMQDAQAMLASG